MKQKRIWLGILAAVIGLSVMGCGNPAGDNDLPVKSVDYVLGNDGFIQCYTNDSQYYYYSRWMLYENENDDPNTYEIECKKMSGNADIEYGMVFETSDENPYNYYCVSITTTGWYRVWKRKGTQTDFTTDSVNPMPVGANEKGWAQSSVLNKGYKTLNSIKVTKSVSTYTVYLNDTQVHQFTDIDDFGNMIGFHTTMGTKEQESFPNTPVDVRFRQK